ncbi:hypothetical protein LDENG_00249000 [Lucifuga dentata]|nr:hypothetical protein LDENG_00249000 [Lucifuga dentata]
MLSTLPDTRSLTTIVQRSLANNFEFNEMKEMSSNKCEIYFCSLLTLSKYWNIFTIHYCHVNFQLIRINLTVLIINNHTTSVIAHIYVINLRLIKNANWH